MGRKKTIDYEELRHKNQKELEKVLFGLHEHLCLKTRGADLRSTPRRSFEGRSTSKKRGL
jgi:hypothetical protein